MNARDLKNLFVRFFESQSHKEIPSASLVPENDPTTLFISAGMHPLVPYLLGQPHPLGNRLVDVQKCVRTGDIEEVGDTFHHTFFEMLGNWSLGDYFKEDMVAMSYKFLTGKEYLNIDPKNLAVTVFAGDSDAPRDEESASYWKKQGVPENRIAYLPKKNNWWGPAGTTGPCGPDTEMFFWTGSEPAPETFDPEDSRWLEIWNDVFMQYNKTPEGNYLPLSQKNVDTGMGVERTIAVLSGYSQDNYLTSIWQPIIKKIEEMSGKSYEVDEFKKPLRVVADHIRSAVFIIADGVEPSNKEAGYVLRRLIRRAIRQGKILGIEKEFLAEVASAVIENTSNYAGDYSSDLNSRKEKIFEVLSTEETKFLRTINAGLREINKLILRKSSVTGKEAFMLYESYGFPVEMIKEELDKHNLNLDVDEFEKAREEHSQKSKTLSAGKFKSGLADHSEDIIKYHTATHLLHASLRQLLGDHVQQSGSNITTERLRFDFSHPAKLTSEEIVKIESLVNDKIKQNLLVTRQEIPYTQAVSEGALAFFGAKYPEIVSVYTIGDSKDSFFSKEVCTGPHVENIGSLGEFKIIKEEAAGSGKRRIYAVLK